jgi:hypothetical protein
VPAPIFRGGRKWTWQPTAPLRTAPAWAPDSRRRHSSHWSEFLPDARHGKRPLTATAVHDPQSRAAPKPATIRRQRLRNEGVTWLR